MTIDFEKFSPPLVWDFYVVYQGELNQLYPQGRLWKGVELINYLTIKEVQVNISPGTISIILH